MSRVIGAGPYDDFIQIAAMRFTGLVESEFKRDERTGENRLLDVNPRPWGWQSLCGRAGVTEVFDSYRPRAQVAQRAVHFMHERLADFGVSQVALPGAPPSPVVPAVPVPT